MVQYYLVPIITITFFGIIYISIESIFVFVFFWVSFSANLRKVYKSGKKARDKALQGLKSAELQGVMLS